MRRTPAILGVHRVGYKDPHTLPVACAQRWDLRLAKAKLWGEYVSPNTTGAWQLEDERHMSPEFNEFVGFEMRNMRPGYGLARPENILNKRLPNQSHFELMARRDVPYQDNAMWGKQLYDKTIHGTPLPYHWRMAKDINKAQRNDRKLTQNKFKFYVQQGSKNPPSKWQPIADKEEEDD